VDQLYKTMYGALQKTMTENEALAGRVAALEARVTALEP
jgi:BMFP domain-containing protein YqiC